jgi:hypothetical protein
LDFSRLFADGIAGLGHIDLPFVPDGDVVGTDPGGNQAGGDRIGHLATGARAGIAPGGDFDGYRIIGRDPQILPSLLGGGFACEGGEKCSDGTFDPIRFGIEIRDEGGIFHHRDTGFRIGGGKMMMRCEEKKEGSEKGEGDRVFRV